MRFRHIDIPSLGRRLSNIMAHPSSADVDTHVQGLDAYRQLGGNCLHLHGEGGETHSRQTVGDWLCTHQLRDEFFLCTQICHDGWDDATQRPIKRFTPDAIVEDVETDLTLLQTNCLDLIYLDDRPLQPLEPVVETIHGEMARGRVRAWGVRNWAEDRIHEANACAARTGGPGIAAVVTTELALPSATRPLWPEYLRFDESLERAVRELGLAVFAHASDLTLGQCLFGDTDAVALRRPEWVQRWNHPVNPPLVQHVQRVAAARGLSPRVVNVAWLLNHAFPVVAVVGLPALLTDHGVHYEHASRWNLSATDLGDLNACRLGVDG